jgi:hypothetical protein
VPILGKKLADGDVALAGGHRLGRGAATQLGRGAVALGRRGGLYFWGRTSSQSKGSFHRFRDDQSVWGCNWIRGGRRKLPIRHFRSCEHGFRQLSPSPFCSGSR